MLRTPAGTGTAGFSGDGGQGASAALSSPVSVAVDGAGNLFIGDLGNRRVRRVEPSGRITTYAGNGLQATPPNDGAAATSVSVEPIAVAVDPAGNLLILDTRYSIVVMVTAGGLVRRIAGSFLGFFPTQFSGDGGPATAPDAILDHPLGFFPDAAGNLFISDTSNHRVRKVLARPPSLTVDQTSLTFQARSDGAPAPIQRIAVVANVPGVGFRTAVEYSGAPNWLSVDPANGQTPRLVEIRADPAGLPPGVHQATVLVRAPDAAPQEIRVSVRFEIDQGLPAKLQSDKEHLTFTFPRTGVRRRQTLMVSNAGSGPLNFSAEAITRSGGSWLSVSPAAGTVLPRTPAVVSVEADPAGLSPGTYAGVIRLVQRGVDDTVEIGVTMTISEREQAVLLSQTGLSFTAVAGGGVVPPQTFGVINIGAGVMPWTVSTSTLAGGSAWLVVAPAQGRTDAGAASVPEVEVRIDQSGLAPGRYYGLARVDSPDAANSPQVVTVFLEVLDRDAQPGSVVQPAQLTFEVLDPESNPGAKELTIYNLSAKPVGFRAPDLPALQLFPLDGTVEPARPVRVLVQPMLVETIVKDLHLIVPGVFRYVLGLQFSDGVVRNINVTAIGPETPTAAARVRSADGCRPAVLLPSILSLGQASTVPAGWPAGIAVEVKDDCGLPMRGGSVVVSFSNGDSPVAMQSLGNGRWHGTWPSRNMVNPRVIVRVEAEEPARLLKGTREERADLSAAQTPPAIETGSIVSAASGVPHTPLAPGGLIEIYGTRLTEGAAESPTTTPLPTRLADATVVMAGRALPLSFAGPSQINAIVPYDLSANTIHQVLVRRGSTYSRPVPVNVAEAQPALFSTADRQAIAQVFRNGALNSPENPARIGDTLVLFCAGLGAVDPAVPTGSVAPLSPLSNTRAGVRVRIGDQDAPVAFAGLTPGFAGLYQVNVVVPEGVAPGDRVPVLMEVAGQSSPLTTIAVR